MIRKSPHLPVPVNCKFAERVPVLVDYMKAVLVHYKTAEMVQERCTTHHQVHLENELRLVFLNRAKN